MKTIIAQLIDNFRKRVLCLNIRRCTIEKKIPRATLFLITLFLTGCMSSASIQPVEPQYWTRRTAENALTSRFIGAQTATYLALRGWDKKALGRPREIILELRKQLIAEPNREGLIAFAELSYFAGIRTQSPDDKTKYLLTTARAAYGVLFDPEMGPMLDSLDPDIRFAADLYNYSLSELTEYLLQTEPNLQDERDLQLVEGSVHIVRGHGLENTPAFNKILIAFSYKTPALPNHNRRRGLGVPIVTLQHKKPLIKDQGQWHPPIKEAAISPATLLLHFQQPWKTTRQTIYAKAELWNPLSTTQVQIKGQQIPLEADTSLSLAMIYDLNADYRGLLNMPRFLSGDFMAQKRGLYLMEPYTKNKIPVVFIHGLMDTPLTWLPMINELLSDPVLTQHYQFWFFFYPTTNPILQSASELRESLRSLQQQMQKENKGWNNMVLVGHSMGGLLTRLAITPSGDHFDAFRQQALDATRGDPELQNYLRTLTIFAPLPFVKRAVFMGTPHNGADMAHQAAGRAGSALMTRPDYIRKFLESKDGRTEKFEQITNGIDDLQPDSPFTRSLQASHWDPAIPVHSIIGDFRQAGQTNGTDTIVDYASAHIDGARSELVVQANHLTLHKKIPAIAEVRRILIEHIDQQPVSQEFQAGSQGYFAPN